MGAPLTNTQIPSDSILDLNGRQTYLGNTFILPFPAKSIADTAENPIAVISNPAGSGKSLFFLAQKAMSDGNAFIVRLYLNPIVNVPGAVTVALNMRSGATTPSVTSCYVASSITSNGTFLTALPASTSGMDLNTLYILDPGAKMLVTAQQVTAGTTNVYYEAAWYEI